jgi:hypothetical protein
LRSIFCRRPPAITREFSFLCDISDSSIHLRIGVAPNQGCAWDHRVSSFHSSFTGSDFGVYVSTQSRLQLCASILGLYRGMQQPGMLLGALLCLYVV